MPVYKIENMEAGVWLIEAPSPTDAVMMSLGEDEYAMPDRIGSRTAWFSIYDYNPGELIDDWRVQLHEEATDHATT